MVKNIKTTKFSGSGKMNQFLSRNTGLENPRTSNNENWKPTQYDSIKQEKRKAFLLKRKHLLPSFMMKLNNLAKLHLALKVKKLNFYMIMD